MSKWTLWYGTVENGAKQAVFKVFESEEEARAFHEKLRNDKTLSCYTVWNLGEPEPFNGT